MTDHHMPQEAPRPVTVADAARTAPHRFDAVSALRLATLLAAQAGRPSRVRVTTTRPAAVPLHDVSAIGLAGKPEVGSGGGAKGDPSWSPAVEFTFGIHSVRGWTTLLDGASLPPAAAGSPARRMAQRFDRLIHLRRYALWVAWAYPSLRRELELACPPHQRRDAMASFAPGDPLGPLVTAIRLRAGLPSGDTTTADADLLGCAWAIAVRSGAAAAEVVAEHLGVPVAALPATGRSACIRLRVGPLSWTQYTGLLPVGNATGLRAVVRRVRLVVGPHADIELTLVLDRRELPGRHPQGTLGYPGWTMFPIHLGSAPVADPEVVISAHHCRRAAARPGRRSQ